jgi:hypothetical protein
MKISRRYAVISFCSDLTNPKGKSYPVAVIGVGESLKLGFLFCGVNLKAVEAAGKRMVMRLPKRCFKGFRNFSKQNYLKVSSKLVRGDLTS